MLNGIFDLTTRKIRVIWLNDLRDDGSFLCPRFHNIISPNDTQETDSTIESVIFDEKLDELAIILVCNKCGCRTFLDLRI